MIVEGFAESVQVGALVDIWARAIPTIAESMTSIVAPTITNEMVHGELEECEVFIKKKKK